MIPSSQMSTSESIEDQRFAELLKPIKDLTQNWEVTIRLPMQCFLNFLPVCAVNNAVVT